jgi:hypothetical protein
MAVIHESASWCCSYIVSIRLIRHYLLHYYVIFAVMVPMEMYRMWDRSLVDEFN